MLHSLLITALLIPMQTLTDWFNGQVGSISASAKVFFTAVVVVFFGIKVLRAKFALSVIAVAVIACALFMWMVDYGGMTFVAKLIQEQGKS